MRADDRTLSRTDPPSAPVAGRVLSIGGGVYRVDTPEGLVEASLRGRVKQTDARTLSVGDLVELEKVEGDSRISRILPRESALTRHGVARRREQVIVANVDQVAVVVAAREPAPDLRMVDRLLALAELSRIRSLLVVNKTDLAELPAELVVYDRIGYDLLESSAETGDGLETLEERLAERVTVLTGQSGVGKSSLLNALLPGLDLRVGEVGPRKSRGRHTTVASALYPFPAGGYVADTPGLQYLALWEVEPARLEVGFREIADAGEGCRFSDCRHRTEPGCAVREAVDDGDIEARRHESYLGLLAEAEEGR